MNAIFESFNSPWIIALGYTLLNSLWQSLIIVTLIIILLRFIPSRFSNARYLIASSGIVLVVCFSVATYIYLFNDSHDWSTQPVVEVQKDSATSAHQSSLPSVTTYFTAATNFIQGNIAAFILTWLLGTIIFLARILTGLLYVQRLRHESLILSNEWPERVQRLGRRLKIDRFVTLAESAAIQAPVIIGFLKPIILIPIGMTSSLTVEQLETIFLHELMHIRRKDYLINLIQSFVEAIYFFNPFVWIVSGIIKREREHCCDDAVVEHYGNARAYVNALATLEELRLSKAGLCLSLAENKNQLLHRIKRLMERSVKNYSSRERIVPALLLVIGLICASWISTQTQERPSNNPESSQSVASDTTKKDKKIKKIKKEKNTKIDHSKIKKSEETDALSEGRDDLEVVVPPAPLPDVDVDIDVPFDEDLDTDVEAMIPPLPDVNLMLENLGAPGLNWRNERDWEEFSKEFEENFKNKFEDFYAKHEKDIEQIMEEVQQKMDHKFDGNWELKMQDHAKKQEEWAKSHAQEWEKAAKKMTERHEAQAKRSEEAMKRMEERQALHQKQFEKNREEFERRMKAFEEKNKRFEAELKNELIKDGYIASDEELKNMHWHNGEIEINGKKIKPEHEQKYNELHAKYFQLD